MTDPRLAYVRLHGRNPAYLQAKTAEERHRHEYTAPELAEIVIRLQGLAQQARDVHVSVNNHAAVFAPRPPSTSAASSDSRCATPSRVNCPDAADRRA